MALIGSIALSVRADTAPLARDMAKSRGIVKSWSTAVARDAAVGALTMGRAFSAFKGAIGVAETAAAVADLGRAAGWTKVGVDRLRLAFTRDAEKAAVLRGRIASTTSAVAAFGSATRKVRRYLLFADIGLFAVKLATFEGGVLLKIASGFVAVGVGAVRAAAGVFRFAEGMTGLVGGSARATADLAKLTAALFRKDWKGAGVALFSALRNGREALSWAPTAVGGLAGVVKGFAGIVRGAARAALAIPAAIGRGVVSMARSSASAVLSVGSAFAKVGALAAVAFGAVALKGAAAAAHLTEAFNKTDQVFGNAAARVKENANLMADAYGSSRQAYLDGAAAIGGMLQGMGYAEDDASKLAVGFSNLAADAAAFRDVDLATALLKIRSGLSGESEPLKEWGILIDDAHVKSKAFAMGLVGATGAMTDAAKIQARIALIQDGLSKDEGALARESTGTAARMAEFWGRLEQLWQTIGETTAPLLGAALGGVNTLIAAAGIAWTDASKAVMDWFGVSLDSLEGSNAGIAVVQGAVGRMADAWDFARGAAATFVATLDTGLAAVARRMVVLATFLERLDFTGTLAGSADGLQSYAEQADRVAAAAAETAAAAATRPTRKLVDQAFDAAAARIAEARAKLGNAPAEKIGAPKAEPAVPKAKTSASRSADFAEAARLGSREAASIVLRARHGGGRDDAAEAARKTASNTEGLVPAVRAVAAAIGDKLAASIAPTVAI